ncbi:MAG: rod shape-determining protein [Lachnospiraceae bacterium]|nr:rod shape-determining protein [Lachnospiraceae bacterium]
MENYYVFGLDIGTRTIVGTVGYRNEKGRFVVIAQVSKEHTTRAVLDGQIHDILAVSKIIKEIKEELEQRIERPLNEVCIAAAGRVLKTKTVMVENEFSVETKITKEQVHSLELSGVEKAYEQIREEAGQEEQQFYCVGYSVVQYFLNGYSMSAIELHRAKHIGAELIATFLPDEVVNGLYTAVEGAGLSVASLTLEPLAAIQITIPEKFRLLNIALVDVGAGTSDISITRDGSITAFGMMPLAGDEITEAIAKKFLIDFQLAEKVKKQASGGKTVTFKNIMGEKLTVPAEEILSAAEEVIKLLAGKVAEQILQLNGNQPVSAVFIVGGGGKFKNFERFIAEHLGLPESKVSLRGAEVLKDITFMQKGIKKDSTLITPIGICLNYYEQQNNFIYVQVNGATCRLYDNNKLTVLDALVQTGLSKSDLFPERGADLNITVDGETVSYRGRFGEAAKVVLNGEETDLNRNLTDKDIISVITATKGEDAHATIRDVKKYINLLPDEQLQCGERICKDNETVTEGMELRRTQKVKEILPEKEKTEVEAVSSEKEKKRDSETEPKAEPVDVKTEEPEDTVVYVNGTEVTLLKKKSHIFVDVLDVYPFDMSKAGGRRLITKCNGVKVDFTVPIHGGDEIELIWEA